MALALHVGIPTTVHVGLCTGTTCVGLPRGRGLATLEATLQHVDLPVPMYRYYYVILKISRRVFNLDLLPMLVVGIATSTCTSRLVL